MSNTSCILQGATPHTRDAWGARVGGVESTLVTVQLVFSSHVLGIRVRLGIPLGVFWCIVTAYPTADQITTSNGTP